MRRAAVLVLLAAGCQQPAVPPRASKPASPVVEPQPTAPRARTWTPLDPGSTAPSWRIESTPPGAAVWIDGADTRARTPITFPAPPAGKYAVRFVLDGHADENVEVAQQEGYGLSLGRHLRPRDVVAREEASRIAAQRPVDEKAREATRRFLGDPAQATVRLERDVSLGIPEVTLRVGGDGAGEVSWTWLQPPTVKRAAFRLAASEVRRLFDTVVAQGFADVVGAQRPGVPDEVTYRITLTNGAGQTHSAQKWADDAHPRFDAVLRELLHAAKKLAPEARREIRLPEPVALDDR